MNKIINFFKKIFSIDDTPHKIAGGAAIGILFGILPGGVLTVIIVSLFLRVNKLSAILGVLVTNTWSTFFLAPLAAAIGSLIFDKNYNELVLRIDQIYHSKDWFLFGKAAIFEFALPAGVGFVIISFSISILVYIFSYFILEFFRVNKEKKLITVDNIDNNINKK